MADAIAGTKFIAFRSKSSQRISAKISGVMSCSVMRKTSVNHDITVVVKLAFLHLAQYE